jgi:hypothetical protein
MVITTVARSYQSPDGAFSLEVPSGWTARKEPGSNEISFLLGNVAVSMGAVPTERGETVERWVETSKSLLKEQCPTAEVQTESTTTVAGAPGVTFTMFCPGPRLPTTVRESAALLNGKIFTFNITGPSLEIGPVETDIDSMAKSFRAGVEPAGPAVAASYQDPAHRFSLDIPAGFTLAQRGENGQDGVVLMHDQIWIIISPRQGERPEEAMDSYSRQVQEAYTDLHERQHGLIGLNGHRALTDSFTGLNKRGTTCFIGMTDIDMGRGNSVTITWSAFGDEAELAGVTVQKLQQGIW